MMFEWSYKHCPHFQYLLKVDDDNFVNIANIFKVIRGLKSKNKVYLGRRLYASWTMRHGKYRLNYDEYNVPVLPAFIGGGAVLISYDVVRDMIPYFFLGRDKPPLKLEDLYTAYLVLNANVRPADNQLFNKHSDGKCGYVDAAMSLHFQRAERGRMGACMDEIFSKMKTHRSGDPFVRDHYIGNG